MLHNKAQIIKHQSLTRAIPIPVDFQRPHHAKNYILHREIFYGSRSGL